MLFIYNNIIFILILLFLIILYLLIYNLIIIFWNYNIFINKIYLLYFYIYSCRLSTTPRLRDLVCETVECKDM